MAAEGLTLDDPGTKGAPEVRVTVSAVQGDGHTDTGTRFHAVRYRAVIEIRRARVEITGAPAVSSEPDICRTAAREDLLDRIVMSLTL